MNLFLDTISPKNALILFDDNKNITSRHFFDVRLNESTLLIPEIDNFLKANNIVYLDLENIVVVVGPGSFTGVRTTVLAVNTINFITKKHLTKLTYFDLFQNYPIIKSSSKRDSFVKISENDEIQVLQNEELENLLKEKNIKNVYGDINFLQNIEVSHEIDYERIIKNIKLENYTILEPYYLKKPSIS